ncbi:putative nadph dehydrogenase [Naviculisporaceae sp. PSN 640]
MPFHTQNPRNPAPGAPFYTPAQSPPVGTPSEDASTEQKVPTLFTPLTLRSLTLQNRFVVSPMCTYSADDGHLTDWHLVHLGAFAQRGAALTIVEATGVLPNGRISPEDSGLWQDSQIAPLKRIVDFVHSQGQKIGIQLAHAGRKASTMSPLGKGNYSWGWSEVATAEQNGWPENVWAPSAIPYSKEGYASPKEMTLSQIAELVEAFKASAKRAVEAGVDTIEIHGAHGYLISEFLSPISNTRTDRYGGSFENRIRVLLEVVAAVRSVIPETMPLFVRISATEWMEWKVSEGQIQESWDLPQSIKLASILADSGVDLLDVSSGGNNEEAKMKIHPYYQLDMAGEIREALKKEGKLGKMLIGGVGFINTPKMARDAVQEGGVEGKEPKADLVLVARQFLREPEFVLKTAHELGVKVTWPSQYDRAPFPRREKKL